jgi:hypothetical protein
VRRTRVVEGDQAREHAAGLDALRGRQRQHEGVGVLGEGAADAAHRLERRSANEPGLSVASLPELGERELQERQAAGPGLRGRGHQLVDHLARLEAQPRRLGRPDDDLAHPVGG